MVEAGSASFADRGDRATWGVRAFEHCEHVWRRALHSEGDASEAILAKSGETGGVDRVRVGLGRHLRT